MYHIHAGGLGMIGKVVSIKGWQRESAVSHAYYYLVVLKYQSSM